MVSQRRVVPGDIDVGKGVEGVKDVEGVELVRCWRSYLGVEENPMSPHFRVPRRRSNRVLLAA
jgi:hypothetical protein